MLAHSMGGNIGMHYLAQYPQTFKCAAISSPLFGIREIGILPLGLQVVITKLAASFLSTAYVPGGSDWTEKTRTKAGKDHFSSDPVRGSIHNAWSIAEPDLQVGHVTYGWLHHMLHSCATLPFSSIETPCLIAEAGSDTIVDNKTIRKAAAQLPYAEYLELPDAQHEILMEKDDIRSIFLGKFYEMVEEAVK